MLILCSLNVSCMLRYCTRVRSGVCQRCITQVFRVKSALKGTRYVLNYQETNREFVLLLTQQKLWNTADSRGGKHDPQFLVCFYMLSASQCGCRVHKVQSASDVSFAQGQTYLVSELCLMQLIFLGVLGILHLARHTRRQKSHSVCFTHSVPAINICK